MAIRVTAPTCGEWGCGPRERSGLSAWMRGQPINLPKQILLGSVVALHAFVCFSGLLPG